MKEEFAKLYSQFLKELDAYDKDPYRRHDNFFNREEAESFEGFIEWIMKGYID
jgi:hypothetical protein